MTGVEVSKKVKKLWRSHITNRPGRTRCKPGTGKSRLFAKKPPKQEKPKKEKKVA